MRPARFLTPLTLLLACVTKRTELVLAVHTTATQGLASPAPAVDEYPRLHRIQTTVYWGPSPRPTTPAPGRLPHETVIELGTVVRMVDAGMPPRVALPFPLYALEASEPDATRWVRLEVNAVVRPGEGMADESIGPFYLDVAFEDGLRRHETLVLHRECLADHGALLRACQQRGLTCGLGGACVSATRPAGRDGGLEPDYEACGDGGGFCLRDVPTNDVPADDAAAPPGDASMEGGTGMSPVGSEATTPEDNLDSNGLDAGTGDGATCLGNSLAAPRTDTCNGVARAFTRAAVNVAYYPFVVTRATTLRVGPSASTASLGALAVGTVVGLQSTRNPGCGDGPPLRPPDAHGDGAPYFFGYPTAPASTQRYGWIDGASLASGTRAVGGVACLRGVGGEDFQGQLLRFHGRCEPFACEGATACLPVNEPDEGDADCAGLSAVSEDARVVGRVELAGHTTLRFAPGSSVYRLVADGDAVRVLLRGPRWSFVRLVTSPVNDVGAASPRELRGWLDAAQLR